MKKKHELVKTETGIVVVAGTPSIASLQEALTVMGDYELLRKGALPIAATTLSKGNKTALVIDPTNMLAADGVSKEIFSAQHSCYQSNFMYKYFAGATHPNAKVVRSYGQLVEQFGDKSQRITQGLANSSLFDMSPSSLIFLVNDPTNTLPALSKTTSTDAAIKLYSTGIPGISEGKPFFLNRNVVLQPTQDSIAKGFSTMMKETNCVNYIVNAGRAGKALRSVIEAVVTGSAESAPVKPLAGVPLSAVTQLPGIHASVLIPHGTMKEKDFDAGMKSLGTKLGISS